MCDAELMRERMPLESRFPGNHRSMVAIGHGGSSLLAGVRTVEFLNFQVALCPTEQ